MHIGKTQEATSLQRATPLSEKMLDAFLEPRQVHALRSFSYNDHQALERRFYDLCPKCKKFPADASGHECYHRFSIGGIVDECPKYNGKPWSEEFVAARKKIEGEQKDRLPF